MSSFIFGLPNTIDVQTDEHGWTVIPFGMWPHSAGYQRFGQKEAESIVEAFKSGWGKLKRAICGVPVYKGHPDNPAMANEYPDKTAYGAVSDMEVRDEGLAIKQVLIPAGSLLVANGLTRISPNWFVSDTGERKNERPIYVPTAIKSIGLTKKPNIPNLSLVNTKDDPPMKDLLIKLLALSNEATDDQILAAVTDLTKRPEGKTLDNAKNELAVATGKVAELTGKLEVETKRADEGALALANERKSQIESTVTLAIKEGKIAAAEKETWTRVLTLDLEAGRKLLGNAKPTLKTTARVTSATLSEADAAARKEFANDGGADEDGGGETAANSRRAHIQKLVNSEMKSLSGCGVTGNSLRNKAWANMKRQYPKLFTASDYSKDDGSKDEPTSK